MQPGEDLTLVITGAEGQSLGIHLWSTSAFLGTRAGTQAAGTTITISDSDVGSLNPVIDDGFSPTEVLFRNPTTDTLARIYINGSFSRTLNAGSQWFGTGPGTGGWSLIAHLWAGQTGTGTVSTTVTDLSVTTLDGTGAGTAPAGAPVEVLVTNPTQATAFVYMASGGPRAELDPGNSTYITGLLATDSFDYHINQWQSESFQGVQRGTSGPQGSIVVSHNRSERAINTGEAGEIRYRNESSYPVTLTGSNPTTIDLSSGSAVWLTDITTTDNRTAEFTWRISPLKALPRPAIQAKPSP